MKQKHAKHTTISTMMKKMEPKEHEKKSSPAGNRTPVSRVTGGDTNHYTTEDGR